MYEWTVRACFKKYELGTSFSVVFFLGNVPDDPDEWLVCSDYVGAVHAFVSGGGNRGHRPDTEIEGFVHLNEAIAKHSHLGSLEPSVVVPYLKQNLHWRVQKRDGEPAELPSLEVTVIGTPLSIPPGSEFPVPGEGRRYPGITYGRPGGSRQSDE